MSIWKQGLALLCGVVFLSTHAFGAHLHLCFDGKEPRTSVHVFDGQQGMHHVDAPEQHDDIDAKLADQALAKVFKFPSWLALPPSWSTATVTLIETYSAPTEAVSLTASTSRFLLPPLRGPPA